MVRSVVVTRGVVAAAVASLVFVAGCSGADGVGARPPPVARVVAQPRLPAVERPRACVSATLLVRATGGSVAGDPVETQAALLRSRAFYADAPAGVAARRHFRVERVGTSALVSLQVLADEALAHNTCEWAVSRALKNADPAHEEAHSWLSAQAKQQDQAAAEADKALHAYDAEHGLASAPLDDQLEMIRGELKATRQAQAAGKRGLEPHVMELEERAIELNAKRLERELLARRAENAARLAAAVRDRLAATEMEALLNPPLQLIDACAPCQGVDYALDE